MECSCCGEDRDPGKVASLRCHDEIKVCRVCIGWLRVRAGVPDSTAIMPVRDIDEAVSFYERAGFDAHVYEGGGFAFIERHGENVFDLDNVTNLDPHTNGAGCYLVVPDVEEWHGQLDAAGLPVTPLEDQPWGMREFTLTDPNGNHLRIGKSTPSD